MEVPPERSVEVMTYSLLGVVRHVHDTTYMQFYKKYDSILYIEMLILRMQRQPVAKVFGVCMGSGPLSVLEDRRGYRPLLPYALAQSTMKYTVFSMKLTGFGMFC